MPLFDSIKPGKDQSNIVERIIEAVTEIRTIREYIREKFDLLTQPRKDTLDFEQELSSYLQPLDPVKVVRFDQIVQEIRNTASQPTIDIGKLRGLVGEQYALIYSTSEPALPTFLRNLGLNLKER